MAGVRDRVGVEPEVIDGDAEARASFAGATRVLRDADDPVLVLDIGGGSTELASADGALSLDVGSVRMTERFGEDIDAIAAHARSVFPTDLRPPRVIGVAATVTTLAALDLGLDEYDRERIHGHLLTARAVDEQLQRLAALPLEERRRVPALEPERAPVIVAGATIVREAMLALRADTIEASERDILHGAALAAAELPEPVEGDAPPGAYTCC
jgi:exopolyphosphatase / guanosine-5'-triphosphate,3'-diphosphate pyrophosphatase